MTEEELRRYAALGIRADIETQARNVQQCMKHLETMFHRASGMYVPSRFNDSVATLQDALNEFMASMQKKEAFGYAEETGPVDDTVEGAGEGGGPVPVESSEDPDAESADERSGVADDRAGELPEDSGL